MSCECTCKDCKQIDAIIDLKNKITEMVNDAPTALTGGKMDKKEVVVKAVLGAAFEAINPSNPQEFAETISVQAEYLAELFTANINRKKRMH